MYSYVQNNPLSFTDPDGRECVWDDGSFDSKDDAHKCSLQEHCGKLSHFLRKTLTRNHFRALLIACRSEPPPLHEPGISPFLEKVGNCEQDHSETRPRRT